MKIVGLVASHRKKGNTSLLVEEALKRCDVNGVETDLVFLGDYDIKSCTGCEGCKETYRCILKDDMHKLYKLLLDSDGIICGSPTYFYNVSGQMKLFLDRCYSLCVFDDTDRSVWMSLNEVLGGKYAVVMAVCEQHREELMGYTTDALGMALESLGYRVVDTVKSLGQFTEGQVAKDETTMQKARDAGDRLLKTIQLREKLNKKLSSKPLY